MNNPSNGHSITLYKNYTDSDLINGSELLVFDVTHPNQDINLKYKKESLNCLLSIVCL